MVNFLNDGVTIKYFDGTNIPKMKIINGSVYKIIETDKSSVVKSGVVFMEAIAIEYAKRVGFPAPIVTDMLVQNGNYIFAIKLLNEYFSGEDVLKQFPTLENDLIKYTEDLKTKYEEFGLVRKMDLKDMLVKLENGVITDIVPVDFERLKFNGNLNWNIIYNICNEWNIILPEEYQNLGSIGNICK